MSVQTVTLESIERFSFGLAVLIRRSWKCTRSLLWGESFFHEWHRSAEKSGSFAGPRGLSKCMVFYYGSDLKKGVLYGGRLDQSESAKNEFRASERARPGSFFQGKRQNGHQITKQPQNRPPKLGPSSGIEKTRVFWNRKPGLSLGQKRAPGERLPHSLLKKNRTFKTAPFVHERQNAAQKPSPFATVAPYISHSSEWSSRI